MYRLAAVLILLWPSCAFAADDVWTQVDTALARVFQLKNKLLSARAASRLATTVCRRDRERARAIFVRAMQQLKAADPSGAGEGLPVRGYLLHACSQCDPLLAQQLAATPGLSVFDTFKDDLGRAASDASTDPERAVASALRAAPALPWASDEDRTAFARIMLELRETDADIADEGFYEMLDTLSEEPADSIPSLFALGNYVLGPAANDRGGIETKTLEQGATAYIFRTERPSAPDDLLVIYLETATTALASVPPAYLLEMLPPEEQRRRSVDEELQRDMLERLRPFLGVWAPHMAAVFNVAAQRLSMEELQPPDSIEPSDTTDSYPSFQRQWTRRDGPAMRALLIRKSPDRRIEYEELASFSEAAHALERRRPRLATAIASAMPDGIPRMLIHAGLPGMENAFLFYREASKADPEARPGLLLVAAQIVARYAPDSAMDVLSEAVTALDEFDRDGRRRGSVRWGNRGFVQTFYSAHYRLAVPSVPSPDLRSAAAALARKDPERVLSVISNVRSERRRATALVAWAEAMLAQTRVERSR